MQQLNLKNILLNIVLLYLQQGVTFINRNLQEDDSLAPEKLCYDIIWYR